MYNINRRKFLGLFGCTCCSLMLPSCSTVPITDRKQLTLISEARINKQAANAYEKFRRKSKLINSGKQLNHIFDLLEDLLDRKSISKEDLNYAMVIFGRFGLPEHQHLFGKPPRRENLQKVVLDSTSKQKVQILEEAVKRTSGYNSQVLSEYKDMIETGQSLDSNQLKQIRAIFYRIGMKPQTNSFRKANQERKTIMRRSASEIIENLEVRIARLEKKALFAKQIKKERPKSRDITPTHSDFDYHEIDFNHFLRKEKLSKDEYVLTHMRVVAEQTKTVPVTQYNPDGGETTVLMAFYVDIHAPQENWDGSPNEYAGQYSHSTVMYFKYWSALLAGGSLVNGELISIREAEKFIREAR